MNRKWRKGGREYVYGQLSLDLKIDLSERKSDDDSIRRATTSRRINCQDGSWT